MNIDTYNCPSPGASFTETTDQYIIAFYEIAMKYSDREDLFSTYRYTVNQESNLDMSNSRNIYPLLRNYGFVRYEKNSTIKYSELFTNTGLAYIKTVKLIGECVGDDKESIVVREKLKRIKSDILYSGLSKALKSSETTYAQYLIEIIKFIVKYKSIDKIECAYMLSEYRKDQDNYLDNIGNNIMLYRNKRIDINVSVIVQDKKAVGTKTYIKKELGSFTAFGYLINLLVGANLIKKEKGNRYCIVDDRIQKLIDLIR